MQQLLLLQLCLQQLMLLACLLPLLPHAQQLRLKLVKILLKVGWKHFPTLLSLLLYLLLLVWRPCLLQQLPPLLLLLQRNPASCEVIRSQQQLLRVLLLLLLLLLWCQHILQPHPGTLHQHPLKVLPCHGACRLRGYKGLKPQLRGV
jgi:hypothetical protein